MSIENQEYKIDDVSGKKRSWAFTWFSEEQIDFKNLFQNKYKYCIVGEEHAPTTGKRHYQGYVYWKNARTFNGLKRINKKISWRKAKKCALANERYCKKESIYFEDGEVPSQGKRTDLISLKNDLINGTIKVDDIVINNTELYHQYGRTFNKIEDIIMRKKWRNFMTEGIWYWGETGVGKSHIAFQDFTPDKCYVLNTYDKGWWEGYYQQEVIIINDLRGELSYNFLLQLVDKYPFTVPRRGREPMPFLSKKVVITSSLHPSKIYKNRNEEDSIEQLLRRFKIVKLEKITHELAQKCSNL